jgi:hypothetical protein
VNNPWTRTSGSVAVAAADGGGEVSAKAGCEESSKVVGCRRFSGWRWRRRRDQLQGELVNREGESGGRSPQRVARGSIMRCWELPSEGG